MRAPATISEKLANKLPAYIVPDPANQSARTLKTKAKFTRLELSGSLWSLWTIGLTGHGLFRLVSVARFNCVFLICALKYASAYADEIALRYYRAPY